MLNKTAHHTAAFQGPAGKPENPLTRELPFLQFPGLSKSSGIEHAVFTRRGGVSETCYDSLNISYGTGDQSDRVRANLRIMKEVLAADHLVFMNQCHGDDIFVLRDEHLKPPDHTIHADALVTDLKKVGLLVKQADCQSVILFDPGKEVVSNVHCGWRGNRSNIVGKVVDLMTAEFGCRSSNLLAAVGPSLGPCCAEFVTYQELFPEHFTGFMVRENYFDLTAISRFQLLEAGLLCENIEIAGLCTKCRTDLFFSYRGEGITGRFGTVVMLV